MTENPEEPRQFTLIKTSTVEFFDEKTDTTIRVDRGVETTTISKRLKSVHGTDITSTLNIPNIHLTPLAAAIQGVLK